MPSSCCAVMPMPTANESYIFESRHSTQNLYPPSFHLLLAGVALMWATPTLLCAKNAREAQISATLFSDLLLARDALCRPSSGEVQHFRDVAVFLLGALTQSPTNSRPATAFSNGDRAFLCRDLAAKRKKGNQLLRILPICSPLAMCVTPRLALLRRLFQPACGEVENNAQVIAKSSLLSTKSPQLFIICPPLFRRPPPPFAQNFFGIQREKNTISRKFYTVLFGGSKKKPYICSVKLTQVKK